MNIFFFILGIISCIVNSLSLYVLFRDDNETCFVEALITSRLIFLMESQ